MVKAWTGLLLDIVAVFTVFLFLVVCGIVFWGGRDQGLVCAGMMVLFGFKCLEMAWFIYTCFSFRFRSCLFSTFSG